MAGVLRGDVVITGMSALSPVGGNAAQTWAAVNAGISSFAQHVYYAPIGIVEIDEEEDEIESAVSVATVPILDPYIDGMERLLQLLIPVYNELMRQPCRVGKPSRTGLFLSLPQLDPITALMKLDRDFLPEFLQRSSDNTIQKAKINQLGHVGIFYGIADAFTYLDAGALDCCVIGGVDSWLLEERLKLIDEHWRLKSNRNLDGFIPGEGAAMFVVETEQHARERGVDILARISAPGFGLEQYPYSSKKISTANGLSQALRDVLQQKPSDYQISQVMCTLNGESYYAAEWGMILSRLGERFADRFSLIHPADCYGDVGAASGALLVACGLASLNSGNAKRDDILLWASGDSDKRAAVCLSQK